MSIDSDADLVAMREIGRIVARTLDVLESRVRAGVTTGNSTT